MCSSCQAKVEEPTDEHPPGPVKTIWVDPATFVRLSPEEIAYRKWSEEDQKQHLGMPLSLMRAATETSQPVRENDTRLAPAEQDFLRQGGWSVADEQNHNRRGLVTHRGVIHPDEYVDKLELRKLVCEELGFTYEQISSVYKSGRKSADQRELRGQIDARLLALSREGGNMAQLADALGFTAQVIKTALNRARAEA